MALNRNHSQNGGVLINNGESVLRECKNVELSFSDVTCKTDLLKGTKKGTVYLTPYRLVFVSSNTKDCLGSAMFPYYLMKGCSIEQPVFAANYIKGTVSAEPGGGWEGQAHFKMSFPSGGAIELGQHLFKLATNGLCAIVLTHHAPYTLKLSFSFYSILFDPGMYPSGFDYMAPPPPYPGPPMNWTAPPQNWTAAEAAGSAYYNPSNPHNVYMPMERPPPYAPTSDSPDKKNN
uniref:WBP2 N-terminal like n=1 Tax=Mastacembelus armatus TaxID=205130 RepID=A0A3Q3LJM2_9TELE